MKIERNFSADVVTAVKTSKLDKGDVSKLRELQHSARGTSGRLSKAQAIAVQPSKVGVRAGKLTGCL